MKRQVCQGRIKYVAHHRFDHVSRADIMCVFRALLKRLLRPQSVNNWLIIMKRFAYFYSRQFALLLKDRVKPMSGSWCSVLCCPSQHCVLSSLGFTRALRYGCFWHVRTEHDIAVLIFFMVINVHHKTGLCYDRSIYIRYEWLFLLCHLWNLTPMFVILMFWYQQIRVACINLLTVLIELSHFEQYLKTSAMKGTREVNNANAAFCCWLLQNHLRQCSLEKWRYQV